MTVLATEVQMLQSLHRQILLLPYLLSELLEMLHILLHHSVALSPVSVNIPHIKIIYDECKHIINSVIGYSGSLTFCW